MKKNNKLDVLNSVQILVAPWERGFTCGIMMKSSSKLTSDEYELTSTIARGMIRLATHEPHKVFTEGMKGFSEDRKKNNIPKDVRCIAEEKLDEKDVGEIIDFLDALKVKKDKKNYHK